MLSPDVLFPPHVLGGSVFGSGSCVGVEGARGNQKTTGTLISFFLNLL